MVQKVFTEEEAQIIVDTLLEGNNQYLQERIDKRKSMEVSGGYAWTRPNHLDDTFAKAKLPFISNYKVKKAGESWQYLEFHSNNASKKTMLIIKNRPRLEATFERKGHKQSQYLVDCAAINKEIASQDKKTRAVETIQLELFADEPDFGDVLVQEQFKEFEAFYVIVYGVDEFKHISSVEVVMPNPYTEILEGVQDLTHCLEKTEIVQLEAEELQQFPEEAPMLSEEYGYASKEQEEKKTSE